MPEAANTKKIAVILTALKVETRAVLRQLGDRTNETVSGTGFFRGQFEGWDVAVAEVGSGNVSAAAVAVRALEHYKPNVALFVGVAGGVKDVKIGDVVVGTKVSGYESGKDLGRGFETRADGMRIAHELEQRARVLRQSEDWKKRLDPAIKHEGPEVFVGPIVAGEKVVASNRAATAKLIRDHYGDALAVEMEGRGFLEGAQISHPVQGCVVRGISDLLSGKARTDKAGSQQRAADAASAVAFEILSELGGGMATTGYETAELARTARHGFLIERTLKRAGAERPEDRILMSRLIEDCPGGATIIAPSGYGKTSLATHLFREAIKGRLTKNQSLLPFEVPLPDLVQLALSIPEYLHGRLVSHCGVSLAALQQILRDTGAILLCDGFDRVAAAPRKRFEAALSTFIRDYPKAQVFVLSRPASKPSLALQLLELEALTDDEMRVMEQAILDVDDKHYSVIGLMSETLRTLCKNPLLLDRTLSFWKLNHSFPAQIGDLFESWLSSLLKVDPNDAVSAIVRERGLAVIAHATLDAPLAGARALALFRESGIRADVLNDLVNCDAIRVTGSVVEVQHEAMADYLRAKEVAAAQEDTTLVRLATLPLRDDSFFPVLLMALLRTNRLQAAWWRRLSATSPRLYGEALQYRYDVSAEMKLLEPEKLSDDYLTDLLDGIETPLDGIFPDLRRAVAQHLIADPDGAFAITGTLNGDRSGVAYMLHPRGPPDAPRVNVAAPHGPGTYRYVDLNLSQIRLDSGRLLGAKLLSETVLEMIKGQRLKGGPVWAAERLIGRVRYLAKEYGFPIMLDASLDVVEEALRPQRDRWVISNVFSGGESFSIQSLLEDIETLRATSVEALDPWWTRLGWDDTVSSQSETVIADVLNEHYRRVQIAYAEVVGASFLRLATEMKFRSALPLRWDLTVVRRKLPFIGAAIYFTILPVASWEEAGAEVRFSDRGPGLGDLDEFQKALAKLGRSSSTFYGRSGFTQLPTFDGRQLTGQFDGATTVVHEVCSMLKDELKGLFEAIPHRDGAY